MKTYEIYKNGTKQGELKANSLEEANDEVFATYGEAREVVEVEKEYDTELLEHAVLNQLEADFGDKDFDAYSEMFNVLIGTFPKAKDILFQYLSDTAQKNLEEGLTDKRY